MELQKCIGLLKEQLVKDKAKYDELVQEIEDIESGKFDDKLDELCDCDEFREFLAEEERNGIQYSDEEGEPKESQPGPSSQMAKPLKIDTGPSQPLAQQSSDNFVVPAAKTPASPSPKVSPQLKNLVYSAIAGTQEDTGRLPSPASSPTLSMLLEMPPRGHGQPLPDIPSMVKSGAQSPRGASELAQETQEAVSCGSERIKPGVKSEDPEVREPDSGKSKPGKVPISEELNISDIKKKVELVEKTGARKSNIEEEDIGDLTTDDEATTDESVVIVEESTTLLSAKKDGKQSSIVANLRSRRGTASPVTTRTESPKENDTRKDIETRPQELEAATLGAKVDEPTAGTTEMKEQQAQEKLTEDTEVTDAKKDGESSSIVASLRSRRGMASPTTTRGESPTEKVQRQDADKPAAENRVETKKQVEETVEPPTSEFVCSDNQEVGDKIKHNLKVESETSDDEYSDALSALAKEFRGGDDGEDESYDVVEATHKWVHDTEKPEELKRMDSTDEESYTKTSSKSPARTIEGVARDERTGEKSHDLKQRTSRLKQLNIEAKRVLGVDAETADKEGEDKRVTRARTRNTPQSTPGPGPVRPVKPATPSTPYPPTKSVSTVDNELAAPSRSLRSTPRFRTSGASTPTRLDTGPASPKLEYSAPSPASSVSTNPPTLDEERESRLMKKSLLNLHRLVTSLKNSYVVVKPSVPRISKNLYDEIVLDPVDFTSIKRNIENDMIKTFDEYQAQVTLTFLNHLMFYHESDKTAIETKKLADETFEIIEDFIRNYNDSSHTSSSEKREVRSRELRGTSQGGRQSIIKVERTEAKNPSGSEDSSEDGRSQKRRRGDISPNITDELTKTRQRGRTPVQAPPQQHGSRSHKPSPDILDGNRSTSETNTRKTHGETEITSSAVASRASDSSTNAPTSRPRGRPRLSAAPDSTKSHH